MHKTHKHKVKTFHWVNGILTAVEKIFDSFEEALEHLLDIDCHSGKIYDEHGRMIQHHDKHGHDHHTYA